MEEAGKLELVGKGYATLMLSGDGDPTYFAEVSVERYVDLDVFCDELRQAGWTVEAVVHNSLQ
jgi:hypothetical protein